MPKYSRRALFVALASSLGMGAILVSGTRLIAQDTSGDPSIFVEKPYLQLGQNSGLSRRESMTVLWQTPYTDAKWILEVQSAGRWVPMAQPKMTKVAVSGIEPHRVYTGIASDLVPGAKFTYRVVKDGKPVFTATGVARKPRNAPHRFVVFGDCAQGTPGQKQIAYQTYQAKPDFVLITGDIVYNSGRISEYRSRYFPVYNADKADPEVGAPLTRSTLFVGAPGNHDILRPRLDKEPDALAYFFYWAQPLNGPIAKPAPGMIEPPTGSEETLKAFYETAGANYPRMANFSFDYGNAHWTVIDSNPYVDWTNPELRTWLEKDLMAAQGATWRFVAFHHPGFNSSKSHFNEQQMRLVSDIFEQGKVDVVFNGHVHNYQRSYPLTFAVKKSADGTLQGVRQANGNVAGSWTLDKEFDGEKQTKPKGVLYLVTGGGGAGLYNPEQQDKPDTWQPFTSKYIANVHSMTCVDVAGKTLTFRQISATGQEVDKFTVTK